MSAEAEVPAGAQPQGTDTNNLPGGVEAPVTVPVPQTDAEQLAALATMSDEQLGAILVTPPAPPAAQQEEPPAVIATPQDEEEEEEEEPAPPAAAPTVAQPTPAALERPGAPSRIRLNGLPVDTASKVAQYVEAVRSGKSPEEAAAILAPPVPAATPAPATAPPATAPAPAPEPPAVPANVAEIQGKVTEAEKKLQEAYESYDAVEISKATIALNDLKLDLKDAQAEARQQVANVASYNQQFDSHVASLRAAYPELDDENSQISIRLDELRDLESVRNPGFDKDPAFILRLAAQAAQEVNARSSANTPIPQPTPPGKPRGRTAPGGTPVAKAMTAAEANQQLDRVLAGMSDEEASKFLTDILPIR